MVLIVKQERGTVGPRNSSTANELAASGESIVKSSVTSGRECTHMHINAVHMFHHSGVNVYVGTYTSTPISAYTRP